MKRGAFLACAVAVGTGSYSARASQLETYVLTVSGQSGFGTYVAPANVNSYFSMTGVGLPANGLPAGGLPGVDRIKTASGGLLTVLASATTPAVADSIFGPWSATGGADAKASYLSVGASAHAAKTLGSGDGNSVNAFEAYGKARDTFTASSPDVINSAPGFVRFGFTISGNTTFASGQAEMSVDYQYDNHPSSLLVLISGLSGSPHTGSAAYGGGEIPGFTYAPTSISGSVTLFTAPYAITFGSSFDFTVGLFAAAVPSISGTTDVSFSNTAVLTSIELFNSASQPISNFSITSGSGTQYGASGVVAVPEPASLGLMGLGCVLLLARRRK